MLRKRKSGSDERFLFISETEKTMLKKDSYVMKTGDGVCLVMEELCMKAPGSPAPVPYSRLQPRKDPGSSVFVPVKEHYPDIRPVLTKEEAEDLIENVSEIDPGTLPEGKKGDSRFLEALYSGDPKTLVGLIKGLFLKARERSSSGRPKIAAEERAFRMAEEILYSELALVLNISEEEVLERLRLSAEKKTCE